MADALDTSEKLFNRADAAVARARRLIEENRQWQDGISRNVKRMYFRAIFYPKTVKFFSPLDFPDQRPAYQPFPSEDAE